MFNTIYKDFYFEIKIYNMKITNSYMRKFIEDIGLFIERTFPVILITLSIYIYIEILNENKKLRDKVEALTSLVSYKTYELLELLKEKDSKKSNP
jgi:large-conductance mechanosensitive channel